MGLLVNKINILGLPYHGLVVDGILTLPNNEAINYPGVRHGDTQLVALSHIALPSRFPEQKKLDQTRGFEWRHYAIVADNHLGGVYLGDNWLLYIDENQIIWYLKLGFEVSGNQCTMNCTLETVFGRFNSTYPKISKELVTVTTTCPYWDKLKPLNRFTFERKPDGSEVLIHLYAQFDGENIIKFPEEMSLYEIWKLELKGDGLLTKNSELGTGITASLQKYKTFEEIQNFTKKVIPRVEKKFRVSKTNVKYEYDPKPTEAPLCLSNSCHSTFGLVLVPEGENFTPFDLDRNSYIQSNWYGESEVKSTIVRMLYDEKGEMHAISLLKENKRLNRLHQTFEGRGWGTQGPIHYFFNGFMCAVNGYMPGWAEEYEGGQHVESQHSIAHEVSLLLDGQAIQTLKLEGEISQQAETEINKAVVNNVKVEVKINGQIVRQITEKSGSISNAIMSEPFWGTINGDDQYGVYAKFYCGFLSNNLCGLFVDRFKSSDNLHFKRKESHGCVAVSTKDNSVKAHLKEFYLKGTVNPRLNIIARYYKGSQCWI